INRLFSHEDFFGSGFVALEHGRDQERTAGLAGPVVEVLVVERAEKVGPEGRTQLLQEAEARAVASRVRLLMDEEGWAPRQIVILTPAQTHVGLYQEALSARAVDAYIVGGRGYFARDEVSDVTALLQLLVNPHDDLALVTVLRSALVGMSDDGLYLLGRQASSSRARSLWEAARGGEVSGLGDADRRLVLDLPLQLASLRRRVGRPGLAGLIEDAVSECGYDLCLLASAEGRRRFANVRKLMRMADEFEALEGPDLAGFVTAVRSLGDVSDKEGSASTLAEGEDVVRVMTVHQAKGLEFPVVVLAGLGSDAPTGARSDFVVGDDGNVGVFLKGSQRATYESHDLCWGPATEIAAEQRARSQEEDIRLLYVAMTRARERLVLVGACRRGDKVHSRRIGRICQALGVEAMPSAGATVPLDGLDAVITGVGPSFGEAGDAPDFDPRMDTATRGRPAEAYPRFLQGYTAYPSLRRVSFSAMAAYQRCPRQFYLERVLGLRPAVLAPISPAGLSSVWESPGGPDVGSPIFAHADDLLDESESWAGRDIGLLVHGLLERSTLGGERPTGRSLRHEALELLRANDSRLSDVDLERALLLALAFWRSPFASEGVLARAAREAPFCFSHGDVLISGVRD
ncbi:MAG: 3'-5' exonuclease, partial [bacterium]